jgi:hypothetical protein
MGPEIEVFLETLERAEYLALSGQRDGADVEAIYDRHRDLFDAGLFHAVDPPAGDTRDDLRRAHLREFLAEGIEGYRTRELQDRYLEAEVSAAVDVEGEEIPYRQLPLRIRHEADRV